MLAMLTVICEGKNRTVERALICDIVDQQNSHSTSVISSCDSPEAFLSGGIPYLELHPLSIQLDRPNLEVDTDGRDERWRERVLAESKQTA